MKNLLLVLIAGAAIVAGVLVFNSVNKTPAPEHALYYQQPRVIKPFTLSDHKGQAFGNSELKGKWSWFFLGYTSCPDICPTTLQELNFAYPELQKIADNNQVLLVTVDPKRDSQDKLAQYIRYFHPDFVALRGDHSALFPFARNLGLMYAIAGDEADANASYLVDHSASIVLTNPNGDIAAIFKPKHEVGKVPTINADNLISDFAKIVAGY
ncbi:SCO family protein [Endozoicomonas sp. G2_1]|uniref:SCO family protein n=1 Tax=Endozoicomonas sp. G2_1 TaxID=2821091 RepID=UPI001ADA321F|nr:SCO family protein [Endozoicomonas sp. G2_1]MBO9490021.1 SCO family protein [Endozoicomonas sp. G2_1]